MVAVRPTPSIGNTARTKQAPANVSRAPEVTDSSSSTFDAAQKTKALWKISRKRCRTSPASLRKLRLVASAKAKREPRNHHTGGGTRPEERRGRRRAGAGEAVP